MPDRSGSQSTNDYEELVQRLLAHTTRDVAMSVAIGGNYLPFGILQRHILEQNGLKSNGYVIDLGCGSGRTAFALRNYDELRYLGIDVVNELLAYAAKMCERPDWHFVRTAGLTIPEQSGVADLVCAFSLFSHLSHEETYVYLRDAFRVLKPGGRAIFTFLDFAVPAHWAAFDANLRNINGPRHRTKFIDRAAITVWARHLGYEVVAIYGGDVEYAAVSEPLALDDGRVLVERGSLGQSLAILRKP